MRRWGARRLVRRCSRRSRTSPRCAPDASCGSRVIPCCGPGHGCPTRQQRSRPRSTRKPSSPHPPGVAGGAAVAGALALLPGPDALSPLVPFAAFLGAIGAIVIVTLGARADGRTTPHAILLVGVVFNALAAAALMLVNTLSSYLQAQGVLFWIMGSLSTQSYTLVAAAAAYAVAGLAWLLRHALDLNLLHRDLRRALG